MFVADYNMFIDDFFGDGVCDYWHVYVACKHTYCCWLDSCKNTVVIFR